MLGVLDLFKQQFYLCILVRYVLCHFLIRLFQICESIPGLRCPLLLLAVLLLLQISQQLLVFLCIFKGYVQLCGEADDLLLIVCLRAGHLQKVLLTQLHSLFGQALSHCTLVMPVFLGHRFVQLDDNLRALLELAGQILDDFRFAENFTLELVFIQIAPLQQLLIDLPLSGQVIQVFEIF